MTSALSVAKQGRTRTAKPKAAVAQSGVRRLVRWHLTALGLLAALLLAGQIAVQVTLRVPSADVSMAAQASRQRRMGDRLVLSALAVQAAQTPAQRTVWANTLRSTAESLAQPAVSPAQTDPALAGHLAAANSPRQAMLDAAHGLLAALPPETSAQKTDLSAYIAPLLANQGPYQSAMKAVTEDTRRVSAVHLAEIRGIEIGFCGMMLTACALLGFLGSLPGRSGVSQTVAALQTLEEKKVELDAALGEADRQIAEMRQTLANLSTIDALTGLKNHRAFQEQMEREMNRAHRHGQPLSLLLLDVDQFKTYNESYSHTQGDQALKRLADLLKEKARTTDIPARYGGKEFAVILTETDMMGAVVLGERLRQAIASADGLQRPLTASIGIATLTPHIVSVAALIAQADRALCHAKGDGRNRVSHAHHLPAPLDDEAPVHARAA